MVWAASGMSVIGQSRGVHGMLADDVNDVFVGLCAAPHHADYVSKVNGAGAELFGPRAAGRIDSHSGREAGEWITGHVDNCEPGSLSPFAKLIYQRH